MDPASHAVTHGGAPLELTALEVAVLEHLMRHQGRVVSKTELLDHCWDAAYDGGSAVVEVLIHRLRRKLESPCAAPVIQTRRGEGYLIPADGA
jgi:DNA-binding response OmpR family regulator